MILKKIVDGEKAEGMGNIYALELPYHNVELDGMASMHPSIIMYKKDAERFLQFIQSEA